MTSEGEGCGLTCNGAHRPNKLAETSLRVDVTIPNLKQGSHYHSTTVSRFIVMTRNRKGGHIKKLEDASDLHALKSP